MFRALSGDGQEIHLSCEEVGTDEVSLITYGRKLQTNNFPYDTKRLVLVKGKVDSVTFMCDDPLNHRGKDPKDYGGMTYAGKAIVQMLDLFERSEDSPTGFVTSKSVTQDRVDRLVEEAKDGTFIQLVKFSSKTAYFNREIAELKLAELQELRAHGSYTDFAEASDRVITEVI